MWVLSFLSPLILPSPEPPLPPMPCAHSLMTRKLRQYLRWTWMVLVIESWAPDSGGRSRVSRGSGSQGGTSAGSHGL